MVEQSFRRKKKKINAIYSQIIIFQSQRYLLHQTLFFEPLKFVLNESEEGSV
jgi:hypothetical protein